MKLPQSIGVFKNLKTHHRVMAFHFMDKNEYVTYPENIMELVDKPNSEMPNGLWASNDFRQRFTRIANV